MPDPSLLAAPKDISNEDVEILNEIVALASQDDIVDEKPLAALNNAFVKVCDGKGLSRERDQLYHRWHWELQQKEPGETLRERFDKLLEDRGVIIEYGRPASEADSPVAANAHEAPFARSRHVSLESAAPRAERRIANGTTRRGTRAQNQVEDEDTRPMPLGPQWPRTNGIPKRNFDTSMLANASPANRRDLFTRSDYETNLEFETQLSQEGSEALSWRPEKFKSLSKAHLDTSLLLEDADKSEHEDLPVETDVQDTILIPISRDDLKHELAMRSFLKNKGKRAVLPVFDRWAELKVEHQRALLVDNGYLRHRFLKRELLERFAGVVGMKEVAAEVYHKSLLSKAFSHWSECTKEAVENTALAKEHLVTLRYFRAWQQYTASNDVKVKGHILRTSIKRWKNRLAQSRSQSVQVLEYQDNTLIRRILQTWIWTYRQRWAAQVADNEVKRTAFASILGKLRETREREQLVLHSETREVFQVWKRRKVEIDELAVTAVKYETSRCLGSSFDTWRRQLRFFPLEREIASKLEGRALRSVFSRWLELSRLHQYGKAADRHRVLRTCWDAWNEKLRSHSLAQQINERLLSECLYKWVLAERCSMFQRLRTERLMERCTRRLVEHSHKQSKSLDTVLETFNARQQIKRQQNILNSWKSRIQTQQRHEKVAVAKDSRRITHLAFEQLQSRHEKIRVLECQYEPNFVLFYKGKQTLRTLERACKQSRSRKRHEAYVTVRRLGKQRLCKRYLTEWREDATKTRALNDVGVEMYQTKLETLATRLFDHWKQSTLDLRQRELQVGADRDAEILTRQLTTWITRHDTAISNLQTSLDFDLEHSRRAAYRCLRKLHFRIRFIQERQMGTYLDLRQWSTRDLSRSLLRLWLERSLRQRGVPEADLPPTAKTRRFKNILKNLPAQAVPGEDDPSGSAPERQQQQVVVLERATTPGPPFPSTPSRRFGRGLRTPARLSLQEAQAQAQAAQVAAQETPVGVGVVGGGVAATDSRVRQSRAFGRSTAGIRRTLFAPIPERDTFP